MSEILDPFVYSGVAPRLYGRKAEVRRMLDRIRKFEPLSVVGERRIGKSSLLWHIHQRTVDPEASGSGRRLVSLYLDLQRLPFLGARLFWKVLYHDMLARLDEVGIERTGAAKARFARPSIWLAGFDDFRNLLDELSSSEIGIIVMLDEFDAVLLDPSFDRGHLDQLRHLAGSGGYRFSLITSTRETLEELTRNTQKRSSPFFNIFADPLRLGLMEEEDIRTLVSASLTFGGVGSSFFMDRDVDFVLDVAGRHPFYVQLLCSNLFRCRRSKGNKLSEADRERIAAEFEEQAQPFITYQWFELAPDERALIKSLQKGKSVSKNPDRKVAKRLARRGLLVEDDQSGSFALFGSGFQRLVEQDLELAAFAVETSVPDSGRAVRSMVATLLEGWDIGQQLNSTVAKLRTLLGARRCEISIGQKGEGYVAEAGVPLHECQDHAPLRIPLVLGSVRIGEMSVYWERQDRTGGSHPESETLGLFADLLSLSFAFQGAKQDEQLQRARLVNLYGVGCMLQVQEDYSRLIHILLTGLTHSSMVGLNRAIFFKYTPFLRQLIGKAAIGPINSLEARFIGQEARVWADIVSPEACVETYDKNGSFVDSPLQRMVSQKTINLEESCRCALASSKRQKLVEKLSKDVFCDELREFLESLDMAHLLFIVVPMGRDESGVILCDNIYGNTDIDGSTYKLADVFIDQASRAFQGLFLQEELRATREQALKRVYASVAHKLGQLLPIIQNRMREMRANPDAKKSRQFWQELWETADRAIQTVNAFKGFGTVVIKLETRPVTPQELVEDLVDFVRNTYSDVEVNLASEETLDNCSVQADTTQLKDAIGLLVVNAIDAVPEGKPRIKIGARIASEREVEATMPRDGKRFLDLWLADNGPGITEELKERVFDEFFTSKPHGVGLGLATVREIVQAHGGTVFENGEKGEGAVFNILLPMIGAMAS